MALVVQVATHVFEVVSHVEFAGQLASPTHATHVPVAVAQYGVGALHCVSVVHAMHLWVVMSHVSGASQFVFPRH
jgi:hypothetical protein